MADETYETGKAKRELVEMMRRCSREIKDLRAAVDHLRPKAEAYDNMAALIALLPRRGEAMSPDLARQLDQRIAEVEKEIKGADDAQ